jgi:hypothetical protein
MSHFQRPRRRFHAGHLAVGLLSLAAMIAPVCARAAEASPPADAATQTLRERLSIPWYDAETDKLRPVELRQPVELNLGWLVEPLYWLIVAVVVVVLALVVWLVLRELARRQRRAVSTKPPEESTLAADRVEALPFLRERSHDDLLGQARRHYEQGNYSEAIVYLFSHELVELDRSSLIRLARGKTNRQYLREAGKVRPLASLVERTMVAFEEVFFGRRPLDRAGFEACWHELGQFDQLVSQAQAPA